MRFTTDWSCKIIKDDSVVRFLIISVMIGLSGCAQLTSEPLSLGETTAQSAQGDTFTLQILGINDFHGQVRSVDGEGGMFDLSRHLLHKIDSTDEHSFVLHAGDQVGASPAESALLQDEPSIDFLNVIQRHCQDVRANTCRVIGTTGNHEFDEGSAEMLRLLNGGNHSKGPFIHSNWQGANYETLSANVVYSDSNQRLLKPYTIATVNDVAIGFIGIALDTTPDLLIPGMVDELTFNDQASTVTSISTELQAQGIEAIVVIVHDGTTGKPYKGVTDDTQSLPLDSPFGQFLRALPDSVDLVVSGHSHEFTNAYVKNNQGKSILVTQAVTQGLAYADISVTVSRQSKDIVSSTAEIIMVNAHEQLAFDSDAQSSLQQVKDIVSRASDFARQYTQTLINTYSAKDSGVSLGQFIADSHKYVLKTDLAVMNNGGIRANLSAGEVTWGDLFAIQPFSNSLIVKRFSGEQLIKLFVEENIWSEGSRLDDSGQLIVNGKLVGLDEQFTVGGNAYIMGTKGFAEGELLRIEGLDIDATIDYIKQLPTPFSFSDKPNKKLKAN